MGYREWNLQSIEEEKRLIKAELDRIASTASPKEKLKFILSQIQTLEGEDSLTPLRRYIYIMSALVHQHRYGGLKPAEIEKLFQLGKAVLFALGVKQLTSRFGFLYGELYMALSLIHRYQGRNREAAWEQQVSFYLSRRRSQTIDHLQFLSAAIQALRLGHTSLALSELEKVNFDCLSEKQQCRFVLEKHKALRLSGKLKEGAAFSSEMQTKVKFNSEAGAEWSWEQMWRQCQETGEIDWIVNAVRNKKNAHSENVYVIEAFLLTRIVNTTQYLTRFPDLKSLKNTRSFKFDKKVPLSKVAACVEEIYNRKIPYLLRVEKMGQLLTGSHLLITVEHELLLWAVATRWFFRRRSSGFSNYALAEYQALSLRLTSGNCKDVLGLCSDITAIESDSDSDLEEKEASSDIL